MCDRFRFNPHLIDLDLPEGRYAQTALADLDGDGVMEYVVGQQFGTIFAYKFLSPAKWFRTVIGEASPSDVGLRLLDVDGDGRLDLVAGGAWYRNPGSVSKRWERFVFDAKLGDVHDVACGDINGDGRAEVLTMSDQNDLRWYQIPDDPCRPWEMHLLAPPVHAGLCVGDIDGDGNLDIVRTDRWFRNIRGDASRWEVYYIGPSTMPPVDYQPRWAFDGTICHVVDMNGDGINDIVFADAEIPGGKVWWMQNTQGDGSAWTRHDVFDPAIAGGPRRGAFHSLIPVDMTGDGRMALITAEMEAVPGDAPPRYYLYENADGRGTRWTEHVILDAGLGGHMLVAGDVTGSGRIDIIGKPWEPNRHNRVGGRMFVVYLENVSGAG